MASQPNSYSGAGLVRGSYLANIPCSDNIANYSNYILKDLKPDSPVRSAYEYDQNGLPYAGSHIIDFRKFSGTVMQRSGVPAPAMMTNWTADLGLGSFTYQILTISAPQTTEGLKSWQFDGTQVIN